MKKYLSKLLKPSSTIDRGIFVAFILLNLIFAFAYPYGRLIIADWVDELEIFPRDYPPSAFFKISSFAWLTAECILGAFIAIWAALMIKKLAAWIWSIPIQLILVFVLYLIIGASVGMSIELSIRVIVPIFISQGIGVAIGLLIRFLIRKRRNRYKTESPWWANH